MTTDAFLEMLREYELELYTKAETIARCIHLLARAPDQQQFWARTPQWLQHVIIDRFAGANDAGDFVAIKPYPDIDYGSEFRSVKYFLDTEGLL